MGFWFSPVSTYSIAPAFHIAADADRLRQLVGNLVGNALRYTPQGGTITLCARPAGGQTHIAVTDSGKGIPAEDLAHVFDRFYLGDAGRDRASGGSGLGLTIAREIARAHQGEVTVESKKGSGSCFTVTLPRNTAKEAKRRSE